MIGTQLQDSEIYVGVSELYPDSREKRIKYERGLSKYFTLIERYIRPQITPVVTGYGNMSPINIGFRSLKERCVGNS